MDPKEFEADGRIQVQDPCAATTQILTYYSQFSVFNGWTITIDIHHAAYMLQLYRFDGSLFPRCVSLFRSCSGADEWRRLFLTVRPPTMLPTISLSAASSVFLPPLFRSRLTLCAQERLGADSELGES